MPGAINKDTDTIKKNKQLRRRRRFRQLLGTIVVFLVVVGILSIATSSFNLLSSAFDISDQMPYYQERVKYLVALDTLPFENLSTAPAETLIYAAMYQAIDQQENENYERDENGYMYLPIDDINAAVADLYGPDVQFNYISFTSSAFVFTYVPEKQAYLMPLTSAPTSFAPIATNIKRESDTLRLTIGYDVPYDTIIEPVKYLDYIFTRSEDGEYYLTSIVTSETKVENTEEVPATSDATLPNNEELLDDAGDGILTETENAAQEVQPDAQVPQTADEPAIEEQEPEEVEGASEADAQSEVVSSQADTAEEAA